MNCKAFLRMLDSYGETITPTTAGYSQLVVLGQHLADLQPGVAVVECYHTYIAAYDSDDVRLYRLAYEDLPESIQEGLADLDLNGTVFEYWHATAGWTEL